jgi:bifunctional DNase/RNase
MEVYRVRVEATSGAVLLKEKGGSRYLAMGIGLAEVTAIAVEIDQVQMPRPLTADLLISVIETLGAEVSHVVITSLRNNTFYAEIVMTVGGEKLVLDSRPSDAMALALRTNVPIYAEESLLAEAGIELGQLNGESLNGERDR